MFYGQIYSHISDHKSVPQASSRKVERVHLTREKNAFKITAAIKQTDITQSNKYGEGNLLRPHQYSEMISTFWFYFRSVIQCGLQVE